MTKVATNRFTDGLTMDTNPLVTMDTSLSNCLNGTIITFDGNEQTLQNDSGNTIIKDKDGKPIAVGHYITEECQEVKKDENGKDGNVATETKTIQVFKENTILCVKEYNGVLYIVSKNNNDELEVGSYPSPVYDKKESYFPEGTIDIPTDCNDGNKFYLDEKKIQKLSVSDEINIFEYKKNIEQINIDNKLVDNFYFLKLYNESSNNSLLWTKIFLHSSGNTFDITKYFLDKDDYIVAQLEYGNIYVQIHLNSVEKCTIPVWNANYLPNLHQYNIYTIINLEHNYVPEFLQKCNLIFYKNKDQKLEIPLDKNVELNGGQITINTSYSTEQTDKLFDNIQLQYKHNDKEETTFKLLNDNYTFLSSSYALKDGINITGFTYYKENNELICTITYSEINLNSETSFKICYINDIITEPYLIQEIKRHPHTDLVTESVKIARPNQWGYVLFYANDTLIDMQYLIPFEDDVYSQLNYLNFRQDINNPKYYNVGRDIIQILNTQLQTQEKYSLHFDQITDIELNKNRHIIISDKEQTITVSFTPEIKKFSVNLDTYMPNLEASQKKDTYQVEYDKINIVTDYGNNFETDFKSGITVRNYQTEPNLFTVHKYEILNNISCRYKYYIKYNIPEPFGGGEWDYSNSSTGIYGDGSSLYGASQIEYGLFDNQEHKTIFSKLIDIQTKNMSVNIAENIENSLHGFIQCTSIGVNASKKYLASGKILTWESPNLLSKGQTEICTVQTFEKLQSGTVSGSSTGCSITRPSIRSIDSVSTAQLPASQLTEPKIDLFNVFKNKQYIDYKKEYANISSIVDGSLSFKNEIPDITQTNQDLYCVQNQNIVYNGIQGEFAAIAQSPNDEEEIIGLLNQESINFGKYYVKQDDIKNYNQKYKIVGYNPSTTPPTLNPEKTPKMEYGNRTWYLHIINTLTLIDNSYYSGILYS